MKLSKEVKVGLLALVAGVILYIGFNFLKGVDFFSPTKKYYVVYDNIDGLSVSNPVILNGLTVGRVNEIKLLQNKEYKVVVELQIDDELVLGDSTYALLANTDLLGGKSIELDIGRNTRLFEGGDTLRGAKEQNITEALSQKAMPILTNLDSTVVKLNNLFGDELGNSVKNTMHNFEAASQDLKLTLALTRGNLVGISANLNALTKALVETEQNLRPIVQKMNTLADSLNDLELKKVVSNANIALANINNVTDKINKGEGSLGLLMNDKALYDNLNSSAKDLDKLLIDLRRNPKRYVNFSIIDLGKNKNKEEDK